MKLLFLTIKSQDIERSKIFYELLGFSLKQEQHGNGPIHYSCMIEDLVFELYPTQKENTNPIILGIQSDLNLEILQQKVFEKFPNTKISRMEKELVLNDPDGNKIFIYNK